MNDYKKVERKKRILWVSVAFFIVAVFIARQLLLEQTGNKNRQGKSQSAPEKRKSAEYKRIAVIGDSFVEICLSLGLKDKLVAVGYQGADKSELQGIAHLGGPLDFSEEQLLVAKPDLIISSDSLAIKKRMPATLANKKIEKLFLKHDTFDELLNCIERIGKITSREKRAKEIVAKLVSQINVKRELPASAPRALLVFFIQKDEAGGYKSFSCAGAGTFLDGILRSAGARNALSSSKIKWPMLSVEDIIRLNPDIIFDLRPDAKISQKEVFAHWQKTAPLRAVKNKRVFLITNHYALLPCPKVLEIHEILKKLIARSD